MKCNKVIDLFAGVGGMSLGFEMVGFNVVLANEYDKEIAEAYIKNHPNTKMIVKDITSLSLEEVFKKEIEEMFKKLGYVLNSDVLNAADYGVPQNRRRAVIIGKKADDDNEKVVLPQKVNDKVTIWDAISDLAYLESGEGKAEQKYKLKAQSIYQKDMRKNSNSLFNHQATKHSKLALERLQLLPPEMGKEVLPQEHLTKSIYSGTWSRIVKNDISVTITTRFDTPSSGRFTHPYLNRAITVREAARIQSFPDSFIFTGTKSAQMKQVGNAVPPLLAKAIAEAIKKDMETKDENE